MDINFEQLLEAAKSNRKATAFLKKAAVACQLYETACKLRDMEATHFNVTEEDKAEIRAAQELKNALAMLDVSVSEELAWILRAVVKVHNERGGGFSLHDVAHIKSRKDHLFFEP